MAKIFGQCKSFEDLNYSTDPKTGCPIHALPTMLRSYMWDDSIAVKIVKWMLSLRICHGYILIHAVEVEEKFHVRGFLCEDVGYTAAATQ